MTGRSVGPFDRIRRLDGEYYDDGSSSGGRSAGLDGGDLSDDMTDTYPDWLLDEMYGIVTPEAEGRKP